MVTILITMSRNPRGEPASGAGACAAARPCNVITGDSRDHYMQLYDPAARQR